VADLDPTHDGQCGERVGVWLHSRGWSLAVLDRRSGEDVPRVLTADGSRLLPWHDVYRAWFELRWAEWRATAPEVPRTAAQDAFDAWLVARLRTRPETIVARPAPAPEPDRQASLFEEASRG